MNTQNKDRKHHWLHKIVTNPYLQFSVGMVLLLTILLDSFFLDLHQSMVVLAVFHIAQAVPNLLQAFERIDRIENLKKWKRKKEGQK